MPRHATRQTTDPERRIDEPASPEEMERRREVLARLREKMAKPTTESDKKLWQEFLDLGKQRLTFRS